MPRNCFHLRLLIALMFGLAVSSVCWADSLSFSGNMGASGAVAFHFTVDAGSDLVIQTFGYGGGTNHAGTPFSGTDAQAGFSSILGLYDATGNLLMDSGASPDSGCNDGISPGTANFDSSYTCGDVYLSLNDYTYGVSPTADAGAYTLVLFANDAPPGSLPTDLSAYSFPADGTLYRADGQNVTDFYALDISGANISVPSDVSQVPEPSALWLIASGASIWAFRRRRSHKN